MIGFTTFTALMFTILLIIHLDYIYHFCISKFWYLNLQTNERLLLKKKTNKTEKQTNFFWLYLINLILIGTKFSLVNYYNLEVYFIVFLFTQITSLLFYIIKLYRSILPELKFINLIFQVIIFIFFSFGYVDNFLSIFFLLELLAICYYFFFLTSISGKIYTNINQFKNLLVLYLWNSFWTSILFNVFLLTLIYNYNTLNLIEVKLLWTSKCWYIPYLFIFAIFLKLGFPLFHFFKIQIYYFLDLKLMFFYSIVTTYVNLSILIIISTFDIFVSFIENISIFPFILLGSSIILINAFKTWSLYNFFLYSAITTFFVFIVILF